MDYRKLRRDAQANDGVARTVEARLPFANRSADDIDFYLAEMIGELERLARAHNRDMLAHLLAMASVQAVEPNGQTGGSDTVHWTESSARTAAPGRPPPSPRSPQPWRPVPKTVDDGAVGCLSRRRHFY